jgi:hypothetical protein
MHRPQSARRCWLASKKVIPTHGCSVLKCLHRVEQRSAPVGCPPRVKECASPVGSAAPVHRELSIEEARSDVAVTTNAPKQEVPWRAIPVGQISVQREFSHAVCSAVHSPFRCSSWLGRQPLNDRNRLVPRQVVKRHDRAERLRDTKRCPSFSKSRQKDPALAFQSILTVEQISHWSPVDRNVSVSRFTTKPPPTPFRSAPYGPRHATARR